MNPSLYKVTVTDLGTYTLTVAADTPADAEAIAKSVLFEEATKLADGLKIIKREADAVATVEPSPVRTYRVSGTYSIDFSIDVPASSAAEAERHARRFYEVDPFPFNFATGVERLNWGSAREVVS